MLRQIRLLTLGLIGVATAALAQQSAITITNNMQRSVRFRVQLQEGGIQLQRGFGQANDTQKSQITRTPRSLASGETATISAPLNENIYPAQLLIIGSQGTKFNTPGFLKNIISGAVSKLDRKNFPEFIPTDMHGMLQDALGRAVAAFLFDSSAFEGRQEPIQITIEKGGEINIANIAE